mmetsp:Transcript_59668/g.141886  ORF Transcript_59668/g.141886 Transcript_59668/m.141886 type:complete len:192 (+) Transcript_59668:190-765(+)|eukprot:CAMPEP_0180133684 /NCGR_PEP_ID=MMETSP0986-20121125/9683_1 /TAXON_ID=697907 /ORGANISM="non described non described, Strain CCMP2293" /LENGTH=191 /DNA_ID=CAMNT_0022073841 /DNA_START=190 /DNA_END=765 /DNA_ORIENTATION=+
MAPSPEEQKLEAGVIVKLKGLVGVAKHNGQHGELVNFDEAKGRWAVKLQSDHSILGVKPENVSFVRKPAPQLPDGEDEDDEEGMRLKKLKVNFDRVIKKYKLGSRSDEIADLLTGGVEGVTKITFKDIADRYGMEMDDAVSFLTWIQAAVNFKEQTLDPNTEEAAETAKHMESKDPALSAQLRDAAGKPRR